MAPGTRRATSTAVSMMPKKARATAGEPKSPEVTNVALLATMIPAFFNPMNAMKSPTPQVMAILSE